MTPTTPLNYDELSRKIQPLESEEPILHQPETEGLKVSRKSVNFFGVELPRSEFSGSRSLDPRTFSHYIDDTSAIELQRNIAVSWLLGQPILIEGGTSIGKTETVRRMTSLLGWEMYDIAVSSQSDVDDFLGKPSVNPDRKSPDDPEFIYVLGEMAQGLIAEEGKVKVIFLDEYNAASPGVVIKFHEIFDKYNKGQLYTLVNGQRVKLDKNQIKIIAATNTPGKGYLERNPLDPAQIRRWNYFKLPDKLEESEKAGRALRAWKYKDPRVYSPRTLPSLKSLESKISIESLHSIPNLPDLIVKIAHFHTAAEELLSTGEIGRDQPQKFIYDFNSLMFKITEFVESFYNGNINETVQSALFFYFCNMLHSQEDRARLTALIEQVRIDIPNDPRRIDLTPATTLDYEETYQSENDIDSDTTKYPIYIPPTLDNEETHQSENDIDLEQEIYIKKLVKHYTTTRDIGDFLDKSFIDLFNSDSKYLTQEEKNKMFERAIELGAGIGLLEGMLDYLRDAYAWYLGETEIPTYTTSIKKLSPENISSIISSPDDSEVNRLLRILDYQNKMDISGEDLSVLTRPLENKEFVALKNLMMSKWKYKDTFYENTLLNFNLFENLGDEAMEYFIEYYNNEELLARNVLSSNFKKFSNLSLKTLHRLIDLGLVDYVLPNRKCFNVDNPSFAAAVR